MIARLVMVFRPRTCPVCERRRRFRWYSDTGCCTIGCLRVGLLETAFDAVWPPRRDS